MTEQTQEVAPIFNVVASADGPDKINISADFTAPTSDGQQLTYHRDGYIKINDSNAAISNNTLGLIEEALQTNQGVLAEWAFAQFAAAVSGKEFKKSGFAGLSAESSQLFKLIRHTEYERAGDLVNNFKRILGSDRVEYSFKGTPPKVVKAAAVKKGM
jgi:hypothetical protein